ncbi:hypothetical protein [uncultured Microbacterium sp.]|uniref:Uncharacterized protein n=1 Tax=uncultured Microbacterium sp. TaxID=191216 RepID=A0A1Y5NYN1_9MICO|nr:hypothetical protein [uncultured Microbacterium sp.]SBS70199.1 conserved exported hypothetical protein [uncultured Microbacterium sp.]
MAAKRRVLATIVASGLLTLMTSAAHAAPATSEGAPLDETAATSPREIPARYDPLIGTLDRPRKIIVTSLGVFGSITIAQWLSWIS